MLVVDASVATKWFLAEDDSDDALQLLTIGLKLIGPTLAKYEVASAFARRLRDQEISPDDATEYQDRWLHAVATNVIRLSEDDRDIRTGSELAANIGHLLPDCIYLAMAERLQVPLVTADEAFAKKARKSSESVLTMKEALALAA